MSSKSSAKEMKPHRYRVVTKTYWRHRLWDPDKNPFVTVNVSEDRPAPMTFLPLDGGPVEEIPRDKDGRPRGKMGFILDRLLKNAKREVEKGTVEETFENIDRPMGMSELVNDSTPKPAGITEKVVSESKEHARASSRKKGGL